MSDAEDFSGARGAPDANAGMLRAAGGSRPSPRLIEEINSGEGGDSPTDRLGTLATEANRLFPDRRGTIGVGRSEVVTPGDAADEDDPAARLVRNFRLFLSPAATAKLQAMAGAIKECRRSGDPDMAGVLLKSMQALVDSETLGSSGSRGDEGIKVPVGVSLGAASAGHNPLSAFDHDLLQSFDAHVGRSSLFDSAGVPLITLTTKPAAVFDILGRLVGELNLVRPGGATISAMFVHCLQLDPMSHICSRATLAQGEESAYDTAKALLEHAWKVEVGRTGAVPVDLGLGTYLGDVAQMRRSYGCLLNPANQTGLADDIVPVIRRLDSLLLNLLLKVLDCPFRREASVAGAGNVVALLQAILHTLGFDEVQAVERQLDLLDASPVIPVGPCSFPMENYIKMLIAVWEHKLAMHVKLGANAAERYFRSVLKLPPVGTSRDLQEAVSQFTRTVGSFVRASDKSEEAILEGFGRQLRKYGNTTYAGQLRPHDGGRRSAGGGGDAYMAGRSGNRPTGGVHPAERECYKCWETGHEKRNCPNPARPKPVQADQAQSPEQRGRPTDVAPAGKRLPRSPSPGWKDPCKEGFACKRKESGCALWHPSKPPAAKSAAAKSAAQAVTDVSAEAGRGSGGGQGGGKAGQGGGKAGQGGGKSGGKGGGGPSVAGTWYAAIVAPVPGLGSSSGSGEVALLSTVAGSSVAAVSRDKDSSASRSVRWGGVQSKVVSRVSSDGYAPAHGELRSDIWAKSKVCARAPPVLRRAPPQQFPPHVELPSCLLSKKRTERLYSKYKELSFTQFWCGLTDYQRRCQIVALGANWPEKLNRFFASCLAYGLPLMGYMLDEWEKLTKPNKSVALRGWKSLASPASAGVPPALSVPVAAPLQAPAPAASPVVLDVRPLQRAVAGRAPGVYIVNPLHKCDCLDSGCSVGGMCHRDSPGVHSRRVLAEAERFTITGVAGCEVIKEVGFVDYKVPAAVWHADLGIQELMARIQATFAAEDQLYLYWRVEMFLTDSMRPGLTLFSLGRVVVEDGWTVTLDGAPGASHALSRADPVTSVRLRIGLGIGQVPPVAGGVRDKHDVLLTIPNLEIVSGAASQEMACRTWEVVRVMHNEAQEALAAGQRQRLDELDRYSLFGYVGCAEVVRKWPTRYSALCDDGESDSADCDQEAGESAAVQEAASAAPAPPSSVAQSSCDQEAGESAAVQEAASAAPAPPSSVAQSSPLRLGTLAGILAYRRWFHRRPGSSGVAACAAVGGDLPAGVVVSPPVAAEVGESAVAPDGVVPVASPMVLVAESRAVPVKSVPRGERPYQRPYSESPLTQLPGARLRRDLRARIAKCANPVVVDCCAGSRPFARTLLPRCSNVRVLSIDIKRLEPLQDLTESQHARHSEVVADASLLTMESLGQLVRERFGLGGLENVVFFGAFPTCTHISTANQFGAEHPHRYPSMEPSSPEAEESDALRLHLLQLSYDLWKIHGVPGAVEQPASRVLFAVPSHAAWLEAHPDVTVNYYDQCAVALPGEVRPQKSTVIFGMGLRPFDIACGGECPCRLPGSDLHRLVIAPRNPGYKRRGQQRVSSVKAAEIPFGAVVTMLAAARVRSRASVAPTVNLAAISGFPAHTELVYDPELLHASSGHSSAKGLHRTLADVVPVKVRTNGGAVKLSSEVTRSDIRLPDPCHTCVLAKATKSPSRHTNHAKSLKKMSPAGHAQFQHRVATNVQDRHLFAPASAVP